MDKKVVRIRGKLMLPISKRLRFSQKKKKRIYIKDAHLIHNRIYWTCDAAVPKHTPLVYMHFHWDDYN